MMMTQPSQPRTWKRFIGKRCRLKRCNPQTSWLWICIVLLCCPLLPSTPLQAQTTGSPSQPQENARATSSVSKPQFQRVFVPEDQVGKLVPRDYMPVAVNDLESLLEKFETGEGLDWENQPKVTRAIYTARLIGDQLLSDFNYWEIQYQDDVSGYLPIKPWNLAITNPATNPNRESLSWAEAAQWYVDANGQMWLPIQDSSPLWFGWKGMTNEATNHSRSFSFQVPATTRIQMVLVLANAIEVLSRCGCSANFAGRIRPTTRGWIETTFISNTKELVCSAGQWKCFAVAHRFQRWQPVRFNVSGEADPSTRESSGVGIVDASTVSYQ